MVGAHRMCASHEIEFQNVGWKFLKNGSRRRDGIVVSAAGTVKAVSPAYNTRMLMLLSGEIEVEDLDEDELARGMCKNPDGSFPRRQPELIPKMMFDRMQRELFSRADEALRNNLMNAVGSIAQIAADPSADPGQRLKAATWLFERLRGKTPDVIQLSAQKPYEELLDSVHRGPRKRSVESSEESAPVEQPTVVLRAPR